MSEGNDVRGAKFEAMLDEKVLNSSISKPSSQGSTLSMRFDLPPEPRAVEAMNNHEKLTGLLGSKVIGGEDSHEARRMILKHKEYERTITGGLDDSDGSLATPPSHTPGSALKAAIPISEALMIAAKNANKNNLPRTLTDESFSVSEERDAGSLLLEQNLEAELDKIVVSNAISSPTKGCGKKIKQLI